MSNDKRPGNDVERMANAAWKKHTGTDPAKPANPQAPQLVELREKLKRIHTIADNYPLIALLDSEDFDAIVRVVEQYGREQRIAGLKHAKSRVLRRTEIPADAKNPTRDAVVILGEQIADIIQGDIAELQASRPQAGRTPDEQ